MYFYPSLHLAEWQEFANYFPELLLNYAIPPKINKYVYKLLCNLICIMCLEQDFMAPWKSNFTSLAKSHHQLCGSPAVSCYSCERVWGKGEFAFLKEKRYRNTKQVTIGWNGPKKGIVIIAWETDPLLRVRKGGSVPKNISNCKVERPIINS